MSEATARPLLPQAWRLAWERAAPRERIALAAAAVVVVGALLWTLAWLPLARDLERLRAQQPRTAATLASAQAQADDIVALARASAPAKGGDLRAAIERALTERGLRGPGVTVDAQDDRVRVVLPAAPFATLIGALDVTRKDAGAWVVESTLTPRVEPGTVRADIVFAR